MVTRTAIFGFGYSDFLTVTYGDYLIGRDGPHARPALSHDLNPVDFFSWGYLMLPVKANAVENFYDLRNPINAECNSIRNDSGMFERVRNLMTRRMNTCRQAGGSYFEYFLYIERFYMYFLIIKYCYTRKIFPPSSKQRICSEIVRSHNILRVGQGIVP